MLGTVNDKIFRCFAYLVSLFDTFLQSIFYRNAFVLQSFFSLTFPYLVNDELSSLLFQIHFPRIKIPFPTRPLIHSRHTLGPLRGVLRHPGWHPTLD